MSQGPRPIERMLYPRLVRALANVDKQIDAFVVGSYAPEAPPIPSDAKIACVGSCFAQEISNSLTSQGRSVAPLILSERWNTAFAVRHCLENLLEGTPFPDGYVLPHIQVQGGRSETLRSAGAFILTLGLSVCWFDIATNKMVMEIESGHSAAGLRNSFSTHVMRQTSVADNIAAITAVIESVRRVNATAPIVFTLSPIPLMASITPYPPVASNTISKATLRLALHEVMERQHPHVYYWPSYEIVEWVGKYVRILWGQDDNDLRHLQPSFIDQIMRKFSALYFAP